MLIELHDIDDDGWIVGWVSLGTGFQVVLLVPTDPIETCLADLNGDGIVNGLDLGILLINWSIPTGSPGCAGAIPCSSDLNCDGVVDGLDLGILLGNWEGVGPPCGGDSLQGGGEMMMSSSGSECDAINALIQALIELGEHAYAASLQEMSGCGAEQ
jgi:hypothetical protein